MSAAITPMDPAVDLHLPPQLVPPARGERERGLRDDLVHEHRDLVDLLARARTRRPGGADADAHDPLRAYIHSRGLARAPRRRGAGRAVGGGVSKLDQCTRDLARPPIEFGSTGSGSEQLAHLAWACLLTAAFPRRSIVSDACPLSFLPRQLTRRRTAPPPSTDGPRSSTTSRCSKSTRTAVLLSLVLRARAARAARIGSPRTRRCPSRARRRAAPAPNGSRCVVRHLVEYATRRDGEAPEASAQPLASRRSPESVTKLRPMASGAAAIAAAVPATTISATLSPDAVTLTSAAPGLPPSCGREERGEQLLEPSISTSWNGSVAFWRSDETSSSALSAPRRD